MAIGKNKKQSGGKKGQKKKVIDSLAKKEWYSLCVPYDDKSVTVGLTMVNRSQGKIKSEDQLIGRVFDIYLSDIRDEKKDISSQKYKYIVEAVDGKNCLMDFYGMSITTDKLKSMIRKWHTLIECYVDVKTSDGYILRIFCICFSRRHSKQIKKTSYAQTTQVKKIRKIMCTELKEKVSTMSVSQFVKELIAEKLINELEGKCSTVFPLQNTTIRKVKVLSSPKLNIDELKVFHQSNVVASDISSQENIDAGIPVSRAEVEESLSTSTLEPIPAAA